MKWISEKIKKEHKYDVSSDKMARARLKEARKSKNWFIISICCYY
ncbi:hypothetical protein ONA23_00800 [Mycoplasmopsis cynos]|nr:hypothetical protein [Mycoplasmopsis cynos]WAM06791.1 hypothetical protein ONA23_00800 [Mycoplasmopsis cynos]